MKLTQLNTLFFFSSSHNIIRTNKRCSSTKAEVKSLKERERRVAMAIFIAFIVLVVIISAYLVGDFFQQDHSNSEKVDNASSHLKAVILDQLSLTAPNQTFRQYARSILEQAGYAVSYYAGEEADVEFYSSLPSQNYDLVILRVHSALMKENNPPVNLFTSEPVSRFRYVQEQLANRLVAVLSPRDQSSIYFGITPSFVTHNMHGRFKDTTIIMMGCDGLTYMNMADAFKEKGAKVYISWKGPVMASHTDAATTTLLQNLLIQKQTIKQAIDSTMKTVGHDPAYKSKLDYYPSQNGGWIVGED